MTLKIRILRSLTRLFIILVSLTMSLFSEKMLIFNRCISSFMPKLIKKSWTVSNQTGQCGMHFFGRWAQSFKWTSDEVTRYLFTVSLWTGFARNENIFLCLLYGHIKPAHNETLASMVLKFIYSAAASGWAGWALAHPEFGSSVNPITTRGGRLCPPHYC